MGNSAIAGSPSAAASSAAFTARSIVQPLDPRHGGISACARVVPSMRKIGQIRSSGGQRRLAHQPARPVGAPVAPHPRRGETRPRGRVRLAAAGALRPLGPQRDCLVLRGCHVRSAADRLKLAASYHPARQSSNASSPDMVCSFCRQAYSQMAQRRRAFMSKWKWSLWASLASGPSTVPKVWQASSCTAFHERALALGCD